LEKQDSISEICIKRDKERKMTQSVNNLRVRRTQKLLREALIELIEDRGFDALTVGEITERAMVSRATFYRNYQDKYDLVEQIFTEAMQTLFNVISESGTEHPPQIWVKFFEHIAEYERIYCALLGRKGSPWFVLKMRTSMVDLVKQISSWQPAANRFLYPSSDEFVPDLVATMFVETITWWLEQGRPYPPQEIAKRSALLVSAIFKETSTWQ
jgi:AcrR family transcriptional regulator